MQKQLSRQVALPSFTRTTFTVLTIEVSYPVDIDRKAASYGYRKNIPTSW